MREKTTNIISHILLPGLLFAFLFGDRKNSKNFLVRCLFLNVLSLSLSILQIIPLSNIKIYCILGTIVLTLFWAYSFIGVLIGFKHPVGIDDWSQFLKKTKEILYYGNTNTLKYEKSNSRITINNSTIISNNDISDNESSSDFILLLGRVSIYCAKILASILLGSMCFAIIVVAVLIAVAAIRTVVIAVNTMNLTFIIITKLYGGALISLSISLLLVSVVVYLIQCIRRILSGRIQNGRLAKLFFIISTLFMLLGCICVGLSILPKYFPISKIFFLLNLL
jgi:hypothetical protein